MKFDRIVERYEATYAEFNIETPKEREYLRSYIYEAPSDLLNYLVNSRPPAILCCDNDRIDMLVHSRFQFTFLDSSKTKPEIYLLLTDLFEKKILTDNFCEQVEKAVIEFNRLKV